jgi:hypothetical protein
MKNFQRVGVFKFRGAYNAVTPLLRQEPGLQGISVRVMISGGDVDLGKYFSGFSNLSRNAESENR